MEEQSGRNYSLIFAAVGIVAIIGMTIVGLFLFLTNRNRDQTTAVMPTIAAPASLLRTMPTETAVAADPNAGFVTPTPLLEANQEAVVAAVGEPISHTVQAGQTLYAIAQSYDLTLEQIIAANAPIDPDILHIGDVLIIPVAGAAAPASSSASTTSDLQTPVINGIPVTQLILMDDAVVANIRQIHAQGQLLGRNAYAFSKVGDSTIEIPHFLARFDNPPDAPEGYDLGDYAYLQPTIDHFAGSFSRDSVAVRIGMHSWTMLDPSWADKTICQPNETPLACEIRLHNPSILLIRLGSNDNAGADYFDEQMRQIVEYAIAQGVIPALGTKADRAEGSDINNTIIRQIAADYKLPLWDYDRLAFTLPTKGADVDGVHMTTFYAHDYTNPTAYTRGHAMHNLTALFLLDALREALAP